MMKLLIAAFAAVSIMSLSGCASKSEYEKTAIQVSSIEEHLTELNQRVEATEKSRIESKVLDQTRFCFFDGMAFTEGSIYLGRICGKNQGPLVIRDGKVIQSGLVWSQWKY